MAQKVEASIAGNILSAQFDPGLTFGGRAVTNPWNFPPLPGASIHTGTGAGKADLLGTVSGTLTASTVLIDTSAVIDPFGTSRNFARLKAILILNFSVTDGANLLVGGAATTPLVSIFNGTGTSKVVVLPGWTDSTNLSTTYPGYLLLAGGNLTAYATTGTSKVIQLDSGAATIPYGVALIGASV